MASIATSCQAHQPDDIGLSINCSEYEFDIATNMDAPDAVVSGGVSLSGGIEIQSVETEGDVANGYSSFYYHRLWIIPKRIFLSNVVNEKQVEVEVWNAYFHAAELDDLTETGDTTGVSVAGMTMGTLSALESEMYTLTATKEGSPEINIVYTWVFDSLEHPTLEVTGRRVVPMLLRHNWADPIIEQISYKTDVITSMSGKEQRRKVRKIPRRRVEMTYLTLDASERSLLENTLYAWQNRAFAVPLWFDAVPLLGKVSAGSTAFSVDTQYRDFEVGGLVFVTDGINWDVLEIVEVEDTYITTLTGTQFDYGINAKVIPARTAFLESEFNVARITSQHENHRLAWQLEADQISTRRGKPYTPVMYRGVEVYNQSNDYSDEISLAQSQSETILDNQTGLTTKMQGEAFPRRTYPLSQLHLREEFAEFYSWFANREGMLNPFWFCERVPAFELAANAAAEANVLTVKYTGYTQFIDVAESRRDIAIHHEGSWVYRRITLAEDNGDGTESLTLDGTIGVALSAASNPMISYLKLVRAAQDSVEISHITNGVHQTATSFVDII